MKVITENEIIILKDGESYKEQFSPAAGKGVKDKLKGLVGSGKVQNVLAALGGGQGNPAPTTVTMTPPPEKKGMSTSAKIGIAAGVLLLGAGIWYFGFKKK